MVNGFLLHSFGIDEKGKSKHLLPARVKETHALKAAIIQNSYLL